MVRDSAIGTMGSVYETNIALSAGMIDDPYDLPFLQKGGPKCTPRDVEFRMATSATGHLIKFMFLSRVPGFRDRWIEWRYFRFDQQQDIYSYSN